MKTMIGRRRSRAGSSVLEALCLLAVLALVLTACGKDGSPGGGSEAGSATPGRSAAGGGTVAVESRSLTTAEGEALVALARYTLSEVVGGRPVPRVRARFPRLSKTGQGVFVTLTTTTGRLRGCIGRFESNQPLFVTVQAMAIAAALHDRRFRPVKNGELPGLRVKVSVLSPMRKVTDPLQEVRLGTHGIYIKRGGKRGCYLPEVAAQTGWSLSAFLSNCAASKAGLAPDAWRMPGTEVHVFTTQTFEERARERGRPSTPVTVSGGS